MRKPTICIGENKDADQLRGNREADQRLCFRYKDSTIPLLLKYEISCFWPASVTIQAGLCPTCSETTFLVFPPGGSYKSCVDDRFVPNQDQLSCQFMLKIMSETFLCQSRAISLLQICEK